ncbi:hypothetical protein [uncultured Oscillibacter sp.]|uniref:hypothetical protein n=1 Tax=uncultured Oscillibacter sp. TaxID=876091 RepID=UPI002805B993|nr:hypothetical protein [uncultured Oscillibacter sp.]
MFIYAKHVPFPAGSVVSFAHRFSYCFSIFRYRFLPFQKALPFHFEGVRPVSPRQPSGEQALPPGGRFHFFPRCPRRRLFFLRNRFLPFSRKSTSFSSKMFENHRRPSGAAGGASASAPASNVKKIKLKIAKQNLHFAGQSDTMVPDAARSP